jgi:hypothetical protein
MIGKNLVVEPNTTVSRNQHSTSQDRRTSILPDRSDKAGILVNQSVSPIEGKKEVSPSLL